MSMTDEKTKSNPKYIEIAEKLRQCILDGLYRPDDQLPTEAELTESFGASRQTVRHALALLENQGFLRRVRGSGTYVSGSPYARAQDNANAIGLICTYPDSYLFPSLISGIDEVVARRGASFRFSATKNRFDNERRILLEYLQNPIDGLIIEGTKAGLPNPNLDLYKQLQGKGVPMLFINSYYKELPHSISIVTDDFQGGYDAVAYLHGCGFQRIAGIFKFDDLQGHGRMQGFLSAKYKLELPFSDDDIFLYGTPQKGPNSVLGQIPQFMSKIKQYDALVCYNDEIAVQVHDLMQQNHLSVPKNLGIISFDNTVYAELGSLRLTSFAHPQKEMGLLAAEKLCNIIDGKQEESLVLPWKLVERESTRLF